MISTINTLQYPYLQDKEFLKKIDNCNYRVEFTRIELLDFKTEETLESIATEVINGSININGDSAMRRTANLTVLIKEEKYRNNIEDYLQINKKIKIIKSIENPFLDEYPQYPQLIDFPQGTFVIYSVGFSHSTDSVTASLTLHDKMALLNGECGGTLPAAITFHEKEESDGTITSPTIRQIILELVNHIGQEALSNIHIYDIEDFLKVPLVWKGNEELTPEQEAAGLTDNNLYTFIFDFPEIVEGKVQIVEDLYSQNASQWLERLNIPDPSTDPYYSEHFPDYCNNFWKKDSNNQPTRWKGKKFYWKQYPIETNLEVNKDYTTAQRWDQEVDALFHRYVYLYEHLYPTTFDILEPKIIANKAILPYEYFGYGFTSFSYPGELTGQPGETVVTILDKIKNQLGNYQYFYDVFGNFIFQEIKKYSNNSFVNSKDAQKYEYEFKDNIIQSISTNFDISKLKNDFLIWGTNNNGIPIRYHTAIDQVNTIGQDTPLLIHRVDGITSLHSVTKIEDANINNLIGFGDSETLPIDLFPGYYYWNCKEDKKYINQQEVNIKSYNKFKQDLGLKKERLSTQQLKDSWTYYRDKFQTNHTKYDRTKSAYFNANAHDVYTLKVPMERVKKPIIKYTKQINQSSKHNDFPNKLAILNIGDYETDINSSDIGGRQYFYWGTDEWFECNENTDWQAPYTKDEQVTLSENIRYEKYRFKIHGIKYTSAFTDLDKYSAIDTLNTTNSVWDEGTKITIEHIKNPNELTSSDITSLIPGQWYFWFSKDKNSSMPYMPDGEIQIGRFTIVSNNDYVLDPWAHHVEDEWITLFHSSNEDKALFRCLAIKTEQRASFNQYEYVKIDKVHIDFKVKYYSGDKPEYARDGYDNRNADGTLVKGMSRIYNNPNTCITDYVNHTTLYFQHPEWDSSGFGDLNTAYFNSLHSNDVQLGQDDPQSHDRVKCSDTPFDYKISSAINPKWAAKHEIGKFYYYESRDKYNDQLKYLANLYWGRVIKKYPRTIFTKDNHNYEVTPILFKPGGQFKYLPFYQLIDPQYPVFVNYNTNYEIFDEWDYKDDLIIKPLKQDIKDYRQAIYIEGLLKEPTGIEKNYYYPQLKNEWYSEEQVEKEIVKKETDESETTEKQKTYTEIQTNYLYDIFNERFPLDVTEHPQSIRYFLDIIDSKKLAHFNVPNIGRKTLIIRDDKINCIFEPNPPALLYFTKEGFDNWANPESENTIKQKAQDYALRNGLTYRDLTLTTIDSSTQSQIESTIDPIKEHFIIGSCYNSAYERFRGELAYYISLSSQISLITVPIYYLEPNIRIRLNSQQDAALNCDYIIKSISLPLGADGNMSLSCSKVFERI